MESQKNEFLTELNIRFNYLRKLFVGSFFIIPVLIIFVPIAIFSDSVPMWTLEAVSFLSSIGMLGLSLIILMNLALLTRSVKSASDQNLINGEISNLKTSLLGCWVSLAVYFISGLAIIAIITCLLLTLYNSHKILKNNPIH